MEGASSTTTTTSRSSKRNSQQSSWEHGHLEVHKVVWVTSSY
jgi:hypothetical protein